jgi:hypothetical protein
LFQLICQYGIPNVCKYARDIAGKLRSRFESFLSADRKALYPQQSLSEPSHVIASHAGSLSLPGTWGNFPWIHVYYWRPACVAVAGQKLPRSWECYQELSYSNSDPGNPHTYTFHPTFMAEVLYPFSNHPESLSESDGIHPGCRGS